MDNQDTIDAVPDYGYQEQTPDNAANAEGSADQPYDSGITPDLSSFVAQHSDEAYRMNRKRGKLILICNTQFDKKLKLNDRKGTDKDIAAIQRVFQDILQYEVVVHKELSARQMGQEIRIAAKAESNKECDSFAVFILTHGKDSGNVYGTDEAVSISHLMSPLKNEVLVGKPKMIFVQACRGILLDKGIHMEQDGPGKLVTVASEADFLYVYSTADGYVSFQNPTNGSWFVQALCTELQANWQRLEMMQMLTRMCRAVAYNCLSYTPSNPSTHNLKQVSSITSTLTKAIRFF